MKSIPSLLSFLFKIEEVFPAIRRLICHRQAWKARKLLHHAEPHSIRLHARVTQRDVARVDGIAPQTQRLLVANRSDKPQTENCTVLQSLLERLAHSIKNRRFSSGESTVAKLC